MPDVRAYLRTLLLAAALGVPASAAALVFTSSVHAVETLLWTDLPDSAGWTEPPWWYVLLVPATAGALVAGALRLPGNGGHSPLQGLSLDGFALSALPGILLTALATLGGGLVLGPEAPLVALGLILGGLAGRLAGTEGATARQILAFAGGFATISTVFGGPLPSVLMLFEVVAASGRVPSAALGRMLAPGLLASGVGYLIFTGVGDWPGVHPLSLAVPDLPAYGTISLPDLAWCVPVAAISAAVVVGCRRGGEIFAKAVRRPGALAVLVGSGLLVGAFALAFRAAASRPVDLVLFSGQSSMGAVVTESSAWVLLGLVLAKGLGYAVSLGAGFRGGPIFPALLLGAAVGTLAAATLPGLEVTPGVVAGVAAAAAAALRVPIFGLVMAAVLLGSALDEALTIGVIAAVAGWLVATALQPPPAEAPPAPQASG